MQEDRTYEGYWWHPADPDTKLPGTLSFSQAEIRLELWGAFEAPKPGPVGDMDDEPRILGMTTGGKPVALERNLGLGTSFSTRGASVTSYGPDTVLVGAWYEPDEEVRFDAIEIRFSDLDMWAATSGFSQSFKVDEARNSMDRIDVAFVPPEPVEVALDDTTSLSITWSFTWSGLKRVTTHVSLDQTALFKVSFTNGATLNECLQYVFQLRNFLSLGVGRPIQILAVTGVHRPGGTLTDAPPSHAHPLNVEILFRVVGRVEEPPRRDLLLDEMLFSLGDALPRPEEIFRSWFQRQDVFGPVFNRYFYVVHSATMAREIQFESFVRALETYDRRSDAPPIVPPDEHDAWLSEILDAVPEQHRDRLAQELKYSNEPSLPMRLKRTLSRCPAITKRLIGNASQRKAFVRKVAVTRNYEVHLDPANEREAATGIPLVVLIHQLRALIEMTLVLDLGFTEDTVDAIFDRTGRYRRVEELRKRAREQGTADE